MDLFAGGRGEERDLVFLGLTLQEEQQMGTSE